jgi:hypothetical protein
MRLGRNGLIGAPDEVLTRFALIPVDERVAQKRTFAPEFGDA